MKGFAAIGALYMLNINGEINTCVVIENDFNNNKTILTDVEVGSNYGTKILVDAIKLNEKEPLGPILPVNGKIVIENGREFIKPTKQIIRTYIKK